MNIKQKISVILPVFNCEKYLSKALDSILQQDIDELEVIAVDDGSTDASGRILDEYAASDSRIKPYHKENGGVASARNFALEKTSGKWLAFCDADDLVPLGAYLAMLSATKKVEIVVADFQEIRDSLQQVERKKNGENFYYRAIKTEQALIPILFSPPCLWNKLISRALVERNQLRFCEELQLGEDVEFIARLAALRPAISRTNAIAYYYFNHDLNDDISLNHQYTQKSFCMHLECRQRFLSVCQEANLEGALHHVYHRMIHFLLAFLPLIWDRQEQLVAFEKYREHILQYDWTGEEEWFYDLHNMTLEMFQNASFPQFFYFSQLKKSPREQIKRQFATGQIGFRYLLECAKLWGEYKKSLRR